MGVFSRFRHPKKAPAGNAEVPTTRQEPQRPTPNAEAPTIPQEQQIPKTNAWAPIILQEQQRSAANAEAPTILQEQQKPKTNTEAPTAQGTAAQDNGASKALITDSDTRFELWVEARSRLEKQEQWKTLQEYVVPLQGHIIKGQSVDKTILQTLTDARVRCIEGQWNSTTSSGTKIVYRDVMDKMINYAKVFGDLGGSLAAIDPTGHAPLAWGCVKFFVEAAIKNKEIRDIVLEQETIAYKITRYSIIEELYLSKSSSAQPNLQLDMREAIIELYMRIFTYQAEAYKYLQQNKVYHAFRSFGDNASHPIKKTLDAIEEQILKIDGLGRLEDRQTMLEHHQDLLSKLEKLQEPLIRIGERLDNVVDVLNEAKKLKIRDWISVVPVMDHHRSVVGKVMPDSGQWLLRNAKFLEWRSQSSSSVLWLHGMVGCGKSTLASIIIEYVEQKERVAYYYCNQREENRRKDLTDPTTVLRSFVRQLSFSGPKSSAPSDVIDKYDSAGSLGHLTEDECVGAITHLTNSYPLTTIVVDALDEYGDEDALAGFLQHLYKVIKTSTSLVKVLLTSRNMPTIENLVKEENLSVFDISILSADNKLDINRYAQEKVDEYKKSRRRLFGGPVTDRFAAEIVALLTVRAEGMDVFIFAPSNETSQF
ncbi:hypothetical protein V502_07439 [Pseudogymnoascus sp. VKM F-4520 (FW-2644)]|nr:hypothetical protein V502_07439 [Pseudogymnoascus sp. VKM F-4520 (FW-2644)]